MALEFHEFSGQTEPAIIYQALSLMNGQVQNDGHLALEDFTDMVNVTDPALQVFALIDDDRRVLSVMSVDNSHSRPPKRNAYEVVVLAVQPEYQRQGIGQYMLRQAERRVAAAGGGVLHISSTTDAYDFYIGAGYTPSNNGEEKYVERRIEANTKPIPPKIPDVRTPQEICTNGSYAERVGLGAAVATHALGDLLMAQVYLNESRSDIGTILYGSNSDFVAEISDMLAEADGHIDSIHSTISQGTRLLGEYRAQLAQQ